MNFAYQDAQPESVLSLKEFLNSYRHRCRLQIEIKNRDWELSRRHESKVKSGLLSSAQATLNIDNELQALAQIAAQALGWSDERRDQEYADCRQNNGAGLNLESKSFSFLRFANS